MMHLTAFRAALGDIPDRGQSARSSSRRAATTTGTRRASSRARARHGAARRLAARASEVVQRARAPPSSYDVPVTPRGAGTGNYGQAMPLSGRRRARASPDLDKVINDRRRTACAPRPASSSKSSTSETIHAVGGELRFHPSTYRMASLGGFIAGGSGGVGSIRWGGLAQFRQHPRPQGHHLRGRAAHPRPHGPGHPQGRARLRHQRHHRRSRDAADARTTTGST